MGDQIAPVTETTASPSEVIGSSVILLVRIDRLDFTPWVEESGGLEHRQAKLGLTLEEVLKGKVAQSAGQSLVVEVTQRKGPGRRVSDYLGLWSHIQLRNGQRLLVFCRRASPRGDARVLLEKEESGPIVDAAPVLGDAKAAVWAEAHHVPPAELLASAKRNSGKYGGLYARFLWEEVRAEVWASVPSFKVLMGIIEDPHGGADARETLLSRAYDGMGLMNSPPGEQERLLAHTMLVLVASDAEIEWKRAIATIYARNLLKLTDGRPKYLPSEILSSGERVASLAAVRSIPGSEPLRSWLEKP